MPNLNFDDSLFWSPSDFAARGVGRQLLREKHRGLLLAAPSTVDLSARDSFPIAVWQADEIRRLVSRSLPERALAVVVNRRSGRVQVGSLADPDVEPLPPPSPPDGMTEIPPLPAGSAVNELTADLRERINFPWRAGDVLLTVVLLDGVSNRVAVSLRPSAASNDFRDDAVEALLAAEYARLHPQPAWPRPGDPLPSYRHRQESPPVPVEPGIALAVERAVPERTGVRWMLRGSWRLPLQPRHVVRELDAETERQVARGMQAPSAIIPATLLMTGPDSSNDVVVELHLPSFDPVDPAALPATVTGYFNLDLRELLGTAVVAQTYFLYMFSGEAMVGPVQTALVSADLLPSR